MKTSLIFKRVALLTLSMLIVLSILAAALPRAAQAAGPAADCSNVYVVKAGDSLYGIARRYYTTASRLANYNELKWPYTLEAGDEVCIPKVTFSNPNAVWTATLTDTGLQLEGTGFKKQYAYFVRVRENDTAPWYKLGKFQTTKEGAVEEDESFDLPRSLDGVPVLNVCLKDQITDGVICKQVVKQ
jgi:hypothetical protein